MNNNYYNPNFLFRSTPVTPVNYMNMVGGMARGTTPLPRISSLLSGSQLPRTGAALGATSGVSKITFSSLLNGASKTLGVINQAIPVFYQVKPIWNNAKTMFRVVKELNSSDTKSTLNNTSSVNVQREVEEVNTQKKERDNSPTFFI